MTFRGALHLGVAWQQRMRDVFDTSQFQMAESRTSLRSSENKRCTFVRGLPPELWRTIFGQALNSVDLWFLHDVYSLSGRKIRSPFFHHVNRFLPVTDLCRANLVCKTWRELGDSLDGTTWKEHFLRRYWFWKGTELTCISCFWILTHQE